jgi:hypothetical protein
VEVVLFPPEGPNAVVYVERANRMLAANDDARSLLRLLGRFRVRLGLERTLVLLMRGLMVSAVVIIGASVLEWLSGGLRVVELALLPLGAALLVALARWPSRRETAEQVDRRLGLAERLATAVELSHARAHGRFDELQVADAVAHARSARSGWLHLEGHASREGFVLLTLMLLALGSRLLPTLPVPTFEAGEPTVAADTSSLDQERSLPPEVLDAQAVAAQRQLATAAQPQSDADLAARVQQAQSEQQALDKLSDALKGVSAGQAAADAIQRGDFSTARDQLANLGEEADQLSDAAKQRLAQDLQAAANASTSDRALADRERQAAQALGRNNYAEQRQALRQLGDQVERSASRSVSQDQLARDVGRLQQQASVSGAGQSTASSTTQGASTGSQSSQGSAQAGAAQTGQGGAGDGQQQGGAGVGSGSDPEALGNQNPSLGGNGERVEVPAQLGNGPGVRPATGNEDQVGANPNPSTRSVSELAQAQRTGQVAPEQNLVPGEQRPVVRGYFR